MGSNSRKSQLQQLKSVWPQVWALMWPRRGLLAGSFVLLMINRIMGLALPYSSKLFIDRVIKEHDDDFLITLITSVALATILQAVAAYGLIQLLSKEGQRAIAEMRRKVQAHISSLSIGYYDSNNVGALVSRVMTDTEGLRSLIGTGLMELIGGLFTAVVVLVLMMRISHLMTALAVVALVLFAIALKSALKSVRSIFRERGRIHAEVTGRLTESLGAARIVKGYHAERREQEVFSGGVLRILGVVLRTLDSMSLMTVGSTLLMGLIGSIIMCVGYREIISGAMTIGGFFQYTMYVGVLTAPVLQLANTGPQLTEALAGLDRTREVLAEPPEDQDPRRTVALDRIRGEVSFEGVEFAYQAGKTVLNGITFTSDPGTVTALVGSSGSGKSTIIGLVAAFYNPTAGRVLVDGTDLRLLRLDSYRPILGVVLQEPFLLDGSIRENVAFSRPDATEEEIMRACRIARVDEFAEELEQKYDSIIGERGVKLSGGQRQRVSIARAVLADPKILILDEATSSLDSESEIFIQEALKDLMRGRTTFVIAHRLSTVRQADQILVVEEGRIVERGTHSSLYQLQGRYYDLYTKQQGAMSNLLDPGEAEQVIERAPAARAGDAVPTAFNLIRGHGV